MVTLTGQANRARGINSNLHLSFSPLDLQTEDICQFFSSILSIWQAFLLQSMNVLSFSFLAAATLKKWIGRGQGARYGFIRPRWTYFSSNKLPLDTQYLTGDNRDRTCNNFPKNL